MSFRKQKVTKIKKNNNKSTKKTNRSSLMIPITKQ